MRKGEKRNTETNTAVDPAKHLRLHYVFTFENPYVMGGTGRIQMLLTNTEARNHAQILANVFGTKVVCDYKGMKFDTEPQSWTNPYYAVTCGELMECVNGLKTARYRAQELANETSKPAYVEHMRGGKWVAIETYYEEEEVSDDYWDNAGPFGFGNPANE